jgi:hypothetical protein
VLKINDTENADCLNCGSPLTGDYCTKCGQKKILPYSSFWYLIKEFLGNYFSFNAQFLHTVRPLFLKPGFLTKQYAEGIRTRYISPVQLYVFTSLIVFILISLINNWKDVGEGSMSFTIDDDTNEQESMASDSAITLAESADSIFLFNDSYPMMETMDDYYHFMDTVSDKEKPGLINRALMRKTIQLGDADPDEVNREFRAIFLRNIPRMLFLLVPVFALLLKLLYLRKNFYYEEHVIFSLHFHTFLFWLILAALLLSILNEFFMLLIPLVSTVYFIMAMKTTYASKKWALFLKVSGMMILYGLTVFFVTIASVVILFLAY